jgi:two-component system sensor histidine kinase FlrB
MQSTDHALALESDPLAALDSVSRELDSSYRDLQGEVRRLTEELAASRSARLRELAEKARLLTRLSELVAALPGGVVLLDAAATVRDANPEALDLLGEPLFGESWSAITARNPALGPDGGAGGRHLSVNGRPLGSSGEQVVLITDTTEMHELQQQLGRRQRLAAMGEMAARLAHQIRTPLSSTTLYLAQLARADLPAQQRERICSRLGERLQHMEGLIESMLDFVRGDAPVRRHVPLGTVLGQMRESVVPQLPARTRLTITPVDNTLCLYAAVDDLAGALSNLVMNAVEAGGAGVHIDVWAGATSLRWLQLRVRDDGPGIAEEALPRIFDPFFTTRARGTGLGLAVVAMTVASHGGEIRARNRATGGAEFLIDLPLAEASAAGGAMEVGSDE